MTIADALKDLYPNCRWTLENFDYDTLEWLEETPKPTLEELTTRCNQLMAEQPLKELRKERNKRLAACDWTQLPNVPLPGAKKYEWETYRQALRDITQTTEDPANPVWPTQPSP